MIHSHEHAVIVSVSHRYLLMSLQHVSALLCLCREVVRQVLHWTWGREILTHQPMAHGIPLQVVFTHRGTCMKGQRDTRLHKPCCKARSEGGTACLPSRLPEVLLVSTESLFATSGAREGGTSGTSLEEKQRLRQAQRQEVRGWWPCSSLDEIGYSHTNVLHTSPDKDRAVSACLLGWSYNPQCY